MKTTYYILPVIFLLGIFGCSKKANNSGNACKAQISDVEGLSVFPADNSWNQDISSAAVDPNSSQIISLISASGLKADFGSGLYDGVPIGIPFDVVCGNQPKVNVIFRANNYDGNYGDESDPGPYPIPSDAPIEGDGTGDSHVLVIDKDNKMLYELYNARVSNGNWEASSGAIYDLNSDKLRPANWTSADAAGLPIFPGLVRYNEIAKGVINHAIRFTLQSQNVNPSYISPARHSVSSKGGQYSLPFGAKIRLKASFDISSYPPHLQVILTAMKKYGLILADIGSNMYFSGAPDSRWDNDELQKFNTVKASNFEVVNYH